MSLFRAREIWSHSLGTTDTFDQGCLFAYSINKNEENINCLVVGSQTGLLRIYSPQSDKTNNGSYTSYKPGDLLLEVQTLLPILQISVGKFVSMSSDDHLAVLHPRKLTVYSVESTAGSTEHGSQYQLLVAYEHNLQRSSHSFVIGTFGGVKGREFFCVQSLDGTFSIFEQESFAFSRFLPNFLIPGPLKYIPRTDSFITVSSSYMLECYRYQVLAVAADLKTKEESQNIKQGKRVTMDWWYNLGEQAVDIHVGNFKSAVASILVLGERHIFCLKDTGQLRFLIKLDYSPSAFFPYMADEDGKIMFMVTTHTKTLLVYKNTSLEWASQLSVVPVDITRISIRNINGVICILSDEGDLMCLYLGTDPSLFTAPTFENINFDYKETDKELSKLYNIIHASQNSSAGKLKSSDDNKAENYLKTEVNLFKDLIPTPDHVPSINIEGETNVKCMLLNVKLQPQTMVSQVRLAITVQLPLEASQNISDYNSLGQDTEVDCYIYIKYGFIPVDLKVQIMTSFVTEKGKQCIDNQLVELPLSLVVLPCIPCKESAFKITIDVNHALLPLSQIFPEYGQENSESSTSAVGIHIIGGPDVAIYSAKSSNRYRIQSGSFEAIWLVLNQLVSRLYTHWGKNQEINDNLLTYNGQLPLKECFNTMDSHHQCRLLGQKLNDQLTQSAAQYRAIQKRLLSKFKDKTPSSLTNLDVLLDSTHHQIMETASKIEKLEIKLQKLNCVLSCNIQILHQLIRLQSKLNPDNFDYLCSAFSSNIKDHIDQVIGWEETTEQAINFVLKTHFSKEGKEQQSSSNSLTTLKDISSLKRHIIQLIEKISDKGSDIDFNNDKKQQEHILIIPEQNALEDSLRSSINILKNKFNDDSLDADFEKPVQIEA